MNPVKASPDHPLDPAKFTPRFEAAARRAGFRPERFGEVRGHSLAGFTKRTPGRRPRVYLSAGIHGDEPAPPLALLRLMEEGFFNARCTWFICPLLNPTGFAARTRENHEQTDLNRDFKNTVSAEIRAHIGWLERQPNFDLTLCLHEDWEAKGYYLYELNPFNRPTLAHVMLAAAGGAGPLETATLIDDREVAEPGIIRPVSDPLLRELWPESIYLRQHHSRLSYTTETPSALPLAQRSAMHCAAIRAAVEAFPR